MKYTLGSSAPSYIFHNQHKTLNNLYKYTSCTCHFLSLYFIGQFKKVWYQWHMRAAKEQARQHIRAASPEPLQITRKRRDVDEGLCQISFASSRKFGTNRICGQRISNPEGMWIKALAKILGTVHAKISHMRAANDLARLHCAVSPEPSLIALKRRDVYQGSGQTFFTSSCDLGTYRIFEQ